MDCHPIDLITDAMFVASDIRRIPMTRLLNAATTCCAMSARTFSDRKEPELGYLVKDPVAQHVTSIDLLSRHPLDRIINPPRVHRCHKYLIPHK